MKGMDFGHMSEYTDNNCQNPTESVMLLKK